MIVDLKIKLCFWRDLMQNVNTINIHLQPARNIKHSDLGESFTIKSKNKTLHCYKKRHSFNN